MNDDFDGGQEMMRMEHGARYGMTRIQYWRLASCVLACEKYAAIRPNVISPIMHEAGCQLEMFGKRCSFTITVRPRLPQISVSVLPLDSAYERGVEAFSGTDSQEDWNRMTSVILETDGLVGWHFATYEGTRTFMREQGIDC